jgi:hypothetical protein
MPNQLCTRDFYLNHVDGRHSLPHTHTHPASSLTHVYHPEIRSSKGAIQIGEAWCFPCDTAFGVAIETTGHQEMKPISLA